MYIYKGQKIAIHLESLSFLRVASPQYFRLNQKWPTSTVPSIWHFDKPFLAHFSWCKSFWNHPFLGIGLSRIQYLCLSWNSHGSRKWFSNMIQALSHFFWEWLCKSNMIGDCGNSVGCIMILEAFLTFSPEITRPSCFCILWTMGKLDAMDHLKFEHSRGANMMIPASSSTQYPHHDCSSTRCYWEMAIGTRNIPNYCCLTCWWYSHYGWSVAPCWLA